MHLFDYALFRHSVQLTVEDPVFVGDLVYAIYALIYLLLFKFEGLNNFSDRKSALCDILFLNYRWHRRVIFGGKVYCVILCLTVQLLLLYLSQFEADFKIFEFLSLTLIQDNHVCCLGLLIIHLQTKPA